MQNGESITDPVTRMAIPTLARVLQRNVGAWVAQVFGKPYLTSVDERACRFGEEAIELVQALGVPEEKVLALVEQVYNKPVGDVDDEVGGAFHTLLALCEGIGMNGGAALLTMLDKVWRPEKMERIRAKRATKVGDDTLPALD